MARKRSGNLAKEENKGSKPTRKRCPEFTGGLARPFPEWFPRNPPHSFPDGYPTHLLREGASEYRRLIDTLSSSSGTPEAALREIITAEASRVLTPAAMAVWEAFCSLSAEDQDRFAWMWEHGYNVASGRGKRLEGNLQGMLQNSKTQGKEQFKQTMGPDHDPSILQRNAKMHADKVAGNSLGQLMDDYRLSKSGVRDALKAHKKYIAEGGEIPPVR
jgi:hypothetical protein